MGETVAKQKSCKENTVVIHSVCFFKKTTKLSFQPAQYIKKTDKGYLKKKRVNFG